MSLLLVVWHEAVCSGCVREAEEIDRTEIEIKENRRKRFISLHLLSSILSFSVWIICNEEEAATILSIILIIQMYNVLMVVMVALYLDIYTKNITLTSER